MKKQSGVYTYRRYCIPDINLHYWADTKKTGDLRSYNGDHCLCGSHTASYLGEFGNPIEGEYLVRQGNYTFDARDGYSLVRLFKWSEAGPYSTHELLCRHCQKWSLLKKWAVQMRKTQNKIAGRIRCSACSLWMGSNELITIREKPCAKCGNPVLNSELTLCSGCWTEAELTSLRKRGVQLRVCPVHHIEYDPERYCGECFQQGCRSTPLMYSGNYFQ